MLASRVAAALVRLVLLSRLLTGRAIVYAQHGEPEDVLTAVEYDVPAPAAGQVLLETVAAPVNPSDINQIQGVYPSKPAPTAEFGTSEEVRPCGNEGLFRVVEAGDADSGLAPGDWVIPLMPNFGTWRTHAVAPTAQLVRLPGGLLLQQAATISVNPTTALQMLTQYKQLSPGDWFIQNGGNLAVGRYAVQIGRLLGLNSILVVRDRADLGLLVDELKLLGATHVITEEESGDKAFGATIKEWVGRGTLIPLALNCVGGKSSTNIARKLGQDGVMVTYGGMSRQPVILPTALHIFKNVTSTGFWLTANTKRDPEAKVGSINYVADLYALKQLVEAPFGETAVGGELPQDLLAAFHAAIALSKTGKQGVVF